MSKSNEKPRWSRSLFLLTLSLGLIFACAAFASGYSMSTPNNPDVASDLKAHAEAAALAAASKAAGAGFKPSLEMKENADFLLTPALLMQERIQGDKRARVCFDGIIELNAPLCRTYVVLLARHWVSSEQYRVAVVWAEPHAGSLNFPIYPPTLNILSDPNQFAISHQLVHTYDGTFPKPLGLRGPFRDRFNSYHFSDIRFAEQEALDLCKALRDGQMGDSASPGPVHRRDVFLPERSITVGFNGKGPTITIAGESRQCSQLEMPYPEGGRRCVVDYEAQKLGGCSLSLPSRIAVYSGDGKRLLQSARLSNFVECGATAARMEENARHFSLFEPNEVRWRELLVQHWLKNPNEIARSDVDTLRALRVDFSGRSVAVAPLGAQLKRVNMLLALDWMRDDAPGLERDFRAYLSLLSSNGLARMILFGGRNVLDTTIRWGWLAPADTLLHLRLDAALSGNDIDSILEFADTSLTTGRLWTTAALMEAILKKVQMSARQRFTAQALRCLALSRIHPMMEDPDHKVRTELDAAQTRWALRNVSTGSLCADLTTSLHAAREAYPTLDQPTRPEHALKSKLDTMERDGAD